MITTNTLPAASGKGRLISLWTLSGLVALAFVFVGGGKLAGTAAMVELFDKVGLGQWFRYLTGLLEVAGGIGLRASLQHECERFSDDQAWVHRGSRA